MEDPVKVRASSVNFWLVGLVVLVTLATVVIAFVPIAECPGCKGTGTVYVVPPGSVDWEVEKPCPRCSAKGKTTFLKAWTPRTTEVAR